MATKRPKTADRPNGRFKVAPEVTALEARANAAGISMYKLCNEAGIHHDTYGRWRRGAGRPIIDTLRKLDDALTLMIHRQGRTQRALAR